MILKEGACQDSENDIAPSRVACQETVRREWQSKNKREEREVVYGENVYESRRGSRGT